MKVSTVIFSVIVTFALGIICLSMYTYAKQEKELYLLAEVLNIEQLEQKIATIHYSRYPTESISIRQEQNAFNKVIEALDSVKVSKATLVDAPGVEGVTISFEYEGKTQRIRFNEQGVVKVKDVIYIAKDEESIQQLKQIIDVVHQQ